jgi:galactose mutarotase-like enzyme
MKHTIENGVIRFVSDSFQTEPWHLGFVEEDVNYFWRPPALESLGAAICFPLLGSLPDDRYTLDGKEYAMQTHGFASGYDYAVAEKTGDSIVYEITDDSATYAGYPYRFRLRVAYSVAGATLRTEYRVLNCGEQDMYFSVGGHPRYACPIGDTGEFGDYFVEFEEPQGVDSVVKHNAPLSEIAACWAPDGKGFRLDARAFREGCFCLYPAPAGSVTLKNRTGSRSLRMETSGLTHLQFWTPLDAPLFCMEPWFGSITSVPPRAHESDWKGRPGTLTAAPGEEKTYGYNVTVGR